MGMLLKMAWVNVIFFNLKKFNNRTIQNGFSGSSNLFSDLLLQPSP